MLKMIEIQCENCQAIDELLIETNDEHESFTCGACGGVAHQILSSPAMFSVTVPTYPGAQRHKAGYQHKYANRPATKTQIGPGGSVSVDHPKK